MFDENGDYNITLGELGRVLKKSGKILSVDDLKAMIKIMDGNGNIDYHFLMLVISIFSIT